MAIYPKSAPVSEKPFILTDEEKMILKRGSIFALEEHEANQSIKDHERDLEHPQDRALRAVELGKFDAERAWEIKRHLWEIFDLEADVVAKVAADVAALEISYKDGVDDPDLLAEVITCEAVDAKVFAQRFVSVKMDPLSVPDPVLPPKPVVEPVEEPIKEGEGEPFIIK